MGVRTTRAIDLEVRSRTGGACRIMYVAKVDVPPEMHATALVADVLLCNGGELSERVPEKFRWSTRIGRLAQTRYGLRWAGPADRQGLPKGATASRLPSRSLGKLSPACMMQVGVCSRAAEKHR